MGHTYQKIKQSVRTYQEKHELAKKLGVLYKSPLKYGYVIEPQDNDEDSNEEESVDSQSNAKAVDCSQLEQCLRKIKYLKNDKRTQHVELSAEKKSLFPQREQDRNFVCRRYSAKINQIIDRRKPEEYMRIEKGAEITAARMAKIMERMADLHSEKYDRMLQVHLAKAVGTKSEAGGENTCQIVPAPTESAPKVVSETGDALSQSDDETKTYFERTFLPNWLQKYRTTLEERRPRLRQSMEQRTNNSPDDNNDLPLPWFSGQYWPLVSYARKREHLHARETSLLKPADGGDDAGLILEDDDTPDCNNRSPYAGPLAYPVNMATNCNIIGFIRRSDCVEDWNYKTAFFEQFRSEVFKCYRVELMPALIRTFGGEILLPQLMLHTFSRTRGGYRRPFLAEQEQQLAHQMLNNNPDVPRCTFVYNEAEQQKLVEQQAADEAAREKNREKAKQERRDKNLAQVWEARGGNDVIAPAAHVPASRRRSMPARKPNCT